MRATIAYDVHLRRLLQSLLGVRHPHLRPLLAVRMGPPAISLYYGDPQPCARGCDGIQGAVRAVHRAGLWVGGLVPALGLDASGRIVLSGVGASWDLRDPFAGHPSARAFDLRVPWRQSRDLHELDGVEDVLRQCA
jgi:hypothetical protein